MLNCSPISLCLDFFSYFKEHLSRHHSIYLSPHPSLRLAIYLIIVFYLKISIVVCEICDLRSCLLIVILLLFTELSPISIISDVFSHSCPHVHMHVWLNMRHLVFMIKCWNNYFIKKTFKSFRHLRVHIIWDSHLSVQSSKPFITWNVD